MLCVLTKYYMLGQSVGGLPILGFICAREKEKMRRRRFWDKHYCVHVRKKVRALGGDFMCRRWTNARHLHVATRLSQMHYDMFEPKQIIAWLLCSIRLEKSWKPLIINNDCLSYTLAKMFMGNTLFYMMLRLHWVPIHVQQVNYSLEPFSIRDTSRSWAPRTTNQLRWALKDRWIHYINRRFTIHNGVWSLPTKGNQSLLGSWHSTCAICHHPY